MKNTKGLTKKQRQEKDAQLKLIIAVERFNRRTIISEDFYADFIEITLDEHKDFFESLKKLLNFISDSPKIDEKTKGKLIDFFPEMPQLNKKAFERINYNSRKIRDLIIACSIYRASVDKV